jgi:hypothetical protein
MATRFETDWPIRSRGQRDLYKGRVVQRCARATKTGKWQPVVSVQPRAGVTGLHQAIVKEEYETFVEASFGP